MAISLLQPRYVKEADLLASNARKLLHRKKDVLSDAAVADLSTEIDRLEAAAKARDELAVKETSESLDKQFSRFAPHRPDASWRENCEVLLVAFVIAIGIRAYFLQPFKIPTGSMQPTLNGIIGHPIKPDQPLPGFLRQTFESLWLGRTYVDAVASEDERIAKLQPVKRFGFLDYTRIDCISGRSYLVHVPLDTLWHGADSDGFGLYPGRLYHKGDPIARGYVDTGDQVFVDKFTYHFRAPRRGDVFVFNTRDILGIPMSDPDVKSQFYIKRLAGTPGDKLRIDYPRLFINDVLAQGFGFERVMARQNGYRGYSNDQRFTYLRTPEDDFTVPPENYFALGDNSFNSSDSRKWGTVPAKNVVGRGLLVYWPFSRHWGLTR